MVMKIRVWVVSIIKIRPNLAKKMRKEDDSVPAVYAKLANFCEFIDFPASAGPVLLALGLNPFYPEVTLNRPTFIRSIRSLVTCDQP